MNEISAGTPNYRPQLIYRENFFFEIMKKNSQIAKNASEH